MASKDELQNALREKYGINKNISQALSAEECERLRYLINKEHSVLKLIESYAAKNTTLGQNNAQYARSRNHAERKLSDLKAEYERLQQSIDAIEDVNRELEERKRLLEEQQQQLETAVKALTSDNQQLESNLQILDSRNTELSSANQQLKQENKDLKNIVDQIKLRLAYDIKELLRYEDSEIRKALIRLFQWTLG